MLNRRDLLKSLAAIPVVGPFIGSGIGKNGVSADIIPIRDYFKEIGVRTFINAAGTYTMLTGSLMHPEVIQAIQYASKQYVSLDELQDAVGARIAELLHCEAATVTAGAASAMSLGLAGVLSGMDPEKAAQIPDLTGMKSEVIYQKSHWVGYVHALRNCGVTMIEVETRKELEDAINDQTAMLWFLNAGNFDGQVQWEEFVEIGKKHGIPTFNDCAADVPPVENLWKFTAMGFDLVCFSGGKGIRGPQSAGLLLGRKDLIAAARLSAPPRGNTVCRTNKVNKEEVLGMLVALEIYLNRDHKKDWELWKYQVDKISESASSVDGVETEIHIPEIANHVPSLRITWDQGKVPINPAKAREKLRQGHPSIETMGGDESINITTWMMNPGEERIVAERVKQVLKNACT
jgi:uncharacterized pyridoxal phosphate-dependent enzyme